MATGADGELILEIGARHKLAAVGTEADGAGHITDVVFCGDRDFTLSQLMIVKPADVRLQVTLEAKASGITMLIPLLDINPAVEGCENITSGVYLGEDKIDVREGNRLLVSTTGGSSGLKQVIVEGKRIDH